MKADAGHADLVDLVARLEADNRRARAERPSAPRLVARDGDRVMGPVARRSPRAAVADAPKSQSASHARAYLGAGAVILGLSFLLLLGQIGL